LREEQRAAAALGHPPHATEMVPPPRLRAGLLFLGRGHAHNAERVPIAAQPPVEPVDERTRIEGIGFLAFGAAELLRGHDNVLHSEGHELAV
jgi:hypothetical protein